MDLYIKHRHATSDHEPFVVLDASALPAQAESVGTARRFTRSSLARFGLPDERLDDLVLAVSEAFTNAVEAHGRRGIDTAIELRSTATVNAVGVEIEDHAGGGTDLTSWQPRPALVDRDHLGSDRGWGIQLMREFVELVSFEATDDGTLVRLAVAR